MTRIAINRKNQMKARKYFGIYGNLNYDLHHKDMTLMDRDPERYNEWRPEDLVVMTHSEHTKYHSQFHDRSNWNYATGKRNGANTHPEKNNYINNNPATKLFKGTHYYNNGVIELRCKDGEQPEGFIRGRLPRKNKMVI